MLFTAVFFKDFNVHTCIITTKGGKKACATFPKGPKNPLFFRNTKDYFAETLLGICSCNEICIDYCIYIGRERKVIYVQTFITLADTP